jgi:competence protein ComEA
MFKFFKDFFHLSNTELKGALVLLFFIVSIFIVPRIYFYFRPVEVIESLEFENWIISINQKEDSINRFVSEHKKERYTDKKIDISYFKFNPNTVSYDEMKTLGFDSKTARILIKFREKGAKFYMKKDLLRIYGFEEKLYQKLEKYIVFPVKKTYAKKDWSQKEEIVVEYFNFDPNTVTYQELMKLGVSSRTASILIKFRGDKTVFYKKEDVLKVYGFSEELYVSLEDYIDFPERKNPFKKDTAIKTIKTDENLIVEINSADAETFQKLKGIGSYFSKEIIIYRNKLGGFYSLNQLKEVYGIKEELFLAIEPKLEIDLTKIVKIDLNKAGFKELIRHPYIDKEITVAILKLKKELGGFTKVEDLIYYDTLDKEDFDKIKAYLVVK